VPGCRHPPFTERAIEEISDQWAHWTKASFYHRQQEGSTAALAADCDPGRPQPPPASAGGDCGLLCVSGCYLFAGSFACLTRNLRMLLIPSCARRVFDGALRTLARSLALETLAPGV
jgi:hypothetical protein